MNYMINNEASKQVAIEFAKWVVLNGMWQSDLSFEEQYECWIKELDDVAYDDRVAHDSIDTDHECWVDKMDEDMGPEYDSAGFTEDDRIVNGQYRVINEQ